MLNVELSRWMPYSPAAIYQALTEPQTLEAVVGRISEVKIVEQNGTTGRVAVKIDLPLKQFIETTGDVSGDQDEWIEFQTHKPFPMRFIWRFAPLEQDGQVGTDVYGALNFDLSAFGIPISPLLIKGIVSAELKEDLDRLDAFMARRLAQ